MNGYGDYHDDSDADDEYERSLTSPGMQADFTSSPIESDGDDIHSAENTPTTHDRHGQPFPFPSGPITKWTADQCADFIANLGFEQYSDAFVEDGIDGSAIVELLHEELKELGVASVGHRLTILRNVYDIKLKQNISVLPHHYVPISAEANAPDAHATQDDVARIINQIKLRDERLLVAEEDLRIMREELNRALEETRRLREDFLPLIRMAKDKSQPLPTPDAIIPNMDSIPSPPGSAHEPKTGLSRKFSTKKLFLGGGKMPSPTIHESTSLDPSAAAKAASSQLTASMSSHSSQPSPRSPSSPPYAQSYRSAPTSRFANEESWHHSTALASDRPLTTRRPNIASTVSTPAVINEEPPLRSRGQQAAESSSAMEFMKSFRVSMDEPCHKVLPVALRKYQIEDDWRQYSLYIVHGDQERCLGLQEKPLILFKQLASEGKKPMFMLRKQAAPQEGFERESAGIGSTSIGPGSSASVLGRNHLGSSLQLPGGVI